MPNLQVTKKVQKTAKKVAPKVPTGARKTVRCDAWI